MSRIYVGKGKEYKVKLKNGSSFDTLKFSICLSDIPEAEIFEFKGKQYAKFEITKMKQPDDRGKTHTVMVDDYKKEIQGESQATPSNPQQQLVNPDSLPF